MSRETTSFKSSTLSNVTKPQMDLPLRGGHAQAPINKMLDEDFFRAMNISIAPHPTTRRR